jgi:transcriptional regulator with XRE-family HTH domain
MAADINDLVIENIKMRLKLLDKRPQWLADQTGISPGSISTFLNGKEGRDPRISTVLKISGALGCTLDDLLLDPSEIKEEPKDLVFMAKKITEQEASIATLQAELAQLKAQLASQASDGKPSPLAPDRKKARTLLEQSLSQAHDPKNKKDSK